MPYDLEPIRDDPLSESEQKQRLKDMQAEQERTLRRALGDELYDFADSFTDDLDILSNENSD